MKNNSMIVYKENLISKIKNFFRNLFKPKQVGHQYATETANSNNIQETLNKTETKFFDNIKIDTTNIDRFIDKKNFLEHIDGNVEALKMLSVDRLRKLKEYYDGVIEENDKIIKDLKKA